MHLPNKDNDKEILDFFGLPKYILISKYVLYNSDLYIYKKYYDGFDYIDFEVIYNKGNQNPNYEKPSLIRFYANTTSVIYKKNQLFHRANYAAHKVYYKGIVGYEAYYLKGEFHNSTGPAIISKDNGKLISTQYYINGFKISKNDFFSRKEIY